MAETAKGPQHSLESTIRKEMDDYRNRYGEKDWGIKYFKNFSSILPFPENFKGLISIRNIELNGKSLLEIEQPLGGLFVGDEFVFKSSSILKMEQTPKEFFDTIDKFIKEANLDSEKIKRLNGESKHQELYDYTIPLYIKLRDFGYTRSELTL